MNKVYLVCLSAALLFSYSAYAFSTAGPVAGPVAGSTVPGGVVVEEAAGYTGTVPTDDSANVPTDDSGNVPIQDS